MDFDSTLDALEEQYYNELEENKEAILPTLIEVHQAVLQNEDETLTYFSEAIKERFGGIFIPYIFWMELVTFAEDQSNREKIHELIDTFTQSNFEVEEVKKMKPLLITYFALEREFEINKLKTLIINKAHPDVQEYFRKIVSFSEKNKTSVDMYKEKFDMLNKFYPNFELLKLPVIKLKEKLAAL